ncbi:MAG: Cd2+/Zn2+-exporting ATPase [Erysipelotrichaceae bacterium]|nr:MAG: Cd2+/Zn2+-exporting [Erysipelotrichaceae bacterium]TXT17049.1 MAG: Cd2+/Zn2+-exporting ATPase [Erysipelotrichaceae bacterium]
METKSFLLEGLDCANCAAKIQNDVNRIEGVDASINFVTKTLQLQIEDESKLTDVLPKIRSIISKYEPDVVLVEQGKKREANLVANLEGLSCASCAIKIENEIKKLEGVRSVNVDFATQKITMDIMEGIDLTELNLNVKKVATKIEPEIKVIFGNKSKVELSKPEKISGKGEVEESDDDDEIKKKIIRFILGGSIFAIGLIFKFPAPYELLVFLVSYVIVGGEVVLHAIKGVVRGQIFSEFFLMSVATIGAFAIGQYPEGVAVMLFYMVGELFQDLAVGHSRKSIAALMDIRPDFVNLVVGGELKKVLPEEVVVGDTIVVKPGERIPLDGEVIDGYSMVDTASLTGESIPRELEPGSVALSGFINMNGVLTIKVTKNFSESTVSKILDLIQNASSKKAPTEKFISKFAGYYTPVVVFAALALAILPPLLIPGATFDTWIYRALVFLVISCPCALVISIPLGFFGGIGGASKRGILVKGSNYLEALNYVETVVFDKTGTLTKGVFKVTKMKSYGDYSDDELLEYVAYAESFSTHPIAQSVLSAYNKKIESELIKNYQEIPGFGMKVNVRGKEILVGNLKLMVQEKIECLNPDTLGTIIHVAIEQKYEGYIVISDEVKEDSVAAIKELKALGVKKTVMLTGDSKDVGEKIGKQLGLDEVYSELLPADKVDQIELLNKQKSKRGIVVFVGDGINDAPVLARADIGIAMGGLGSDAAIEAADIVLMTDEPSRIATAIRVAQKTRIIVLQNISFALGVKLIFLVLGALGVSTMWEAVFADSGVALLAVLNAMRVMNVKGL